MLYVIFLQKYLAFNSNNVRFLEAVSKNTDQKHVIYYVSTKYHTFNSNNVRFLEAVSKSTDQKHVICYISTKI